MNITLIYIGSVFLIFWGTAHLFPTKNVVNDFGDITKDNKNIIYMEWINEGVTLIFIGISTLIVTAFGDSSSSTALIIYRCSAVFLFILAIISFFTGFRINFLPYKLCPFIFTIAAALFLKGSMH